MVYIKMIRDNEALTFVGALGANAVLINLVALIFGNLT
jgi:hypothetical protein